MLSFLLHQRARHNLVGSAPGKSKHRQRPCGVTRVKEELGTCMTSMGHKDNEAVGGLCQEVRLLAAPAAWGPRGIWEHCRQTGGR